MIARRVAVGLGGGLLLGASAAVVVRCPDADPVAPRAVLVADVARCPERVAQLREAEALRERHRVAEELVRGLRATEVELIGSPPPWPDDLPASLGPDTIRATLDGAFAGTRYRIDEIDCAEFPCIVQVTWSVDPADARDHTRPSRKLSAEELYDKGLPNRQISVSYLDDGEGSVVMREWTALGPTERIREVENHRLLYRQRMLVALVEGRDGHDESAAEE